MSNLKIQVLIVEDEPIIAADLKKSLLKLGYDVIADVDTGQKVMDILSNQIPDIILMDIRIKGPIDGIETAALVQQTRDIPIIFLTSNSDSSTLRKAMQTKPQAFLSKPFRITDVVNSIEMALLHNTLEETGQEENELSLLLEDRIFIKEKSHLYKILIDDILYIAASGSYTKLYTLKKVYTITYNLTKLETSIDHKDLLRVHRSYVINIRHVDRISADHILIGDHKILISKTYKDELNKRIRAF